MILPLDLALSFMLPLFPPLVPPNTIGFALSYTLIDRAVLYHSLVAAEPFLAPGPLGAGIICISWHMSVLSISKCSLHCCGAASREKKVVAGLSLSAIIQPQPMHPKQQNRSPSLEFNDCVLMLRHVPWRGRWLTPTPSSLSQLTF